MGTDGGRLGSTPRSGSNKKALVVIGAIVVVLGVWSGVRTLLDRQEPFLVRTTDCHSTLGVTGVEGGIVENHTGSAHRYAITARWVNEDHAVIAEGQTTVTVDGHSTGGFEVSRVLPSPMKGCVDAKATVAD